jgi:peptide/nickel transport system ATP-binding protein
VRLTDPETGSMLGKDFVRMSRAEVRDETWHIQMVFQDPFASLNPRHKAIELVAQGPIIHGTPRATAITEAKELFALVGLDPSAAERFPHEFSGGQPC